MYNILLLVFVLIDTPVWFSSTRSIDCKSKKDGDFSLVQMVVRNDPNLDASPPRQTWTISPSSTVKLMEAIKSQISLIQAL